MGTTFPLIISEFFSLNAFPMNLNIDFLDDIFFQNNLIWEMYCYSPNIIKMYLYQSMVQLKERILNLTAQFKHCIK